MYNTQPTNPFSNAGGGASFGIGFQPSDQRIVWMEEVGGIPSLQYAHYYSQWMSRPAYRVGAPDVQIGPIQGGVPDRYLGHQLYSPVVPRGIPATQQFTIQRGFGGSTHEYIGLRAPRLNEGAGCSATSPIGG